MEHKDTCRGARAVLPWITLLSMLTVAIPSARALGDEPQSGQTGHTTLAVTTPADTTLAETTLEVTVTGFKSDAGRLAIALFASADDYSSQTNAIRKAWLAIENGESHWVVEDLPQGDYALIAYQDLNGNEQIDMRIFGMPKEPVGVSNDAKGIFGPPRFEAARFRVSAPLTEHRFRLR